MTPMIQHVAWEVRRELAGPCVDFYKLLGFKQTESPKTLSDPAVWVERDGTSFHLIFVDEPTVLPRGHAALLVDDYEAIFAALEEAGHEPEPREEHWGAPRCYVHDPAGNGVELMASSPS